MIHSSWKKSCFSWSLFGAWNGAGGAVTSCLKLHEVSPNNVLIELHFSQRCQVDFFFFPRTQNVDGTFWRPAHDHCSSWFHILFKALKGSSFPGKAITLTLFLLPNLKHHLWMSEGMRLLLCFCKHTVQSEVYVHLKTRCFHNYTQCCSVSSASFSFCVNTVCTLLV